MSGIVAEAVVIFRFTDDSVSITGWGWLMLMVAASTASSTVRNVIHRDKGKP